jgi:hypothetical protein
MKKNHTQENSEKPSTPNPQQTCEQLDLFDWAKINDETEVGFSVRSDL